MRVDVTAIVVSFLLGCMVGFIAGYGDAVTDPVAMVHKEQHRFMGMPPPPDCGHLDGEAWNVCMGVGRK